MKIVSVPEHRRKCILLVTFNLANIQFEKKNIIIKEKRTFYQFSVRYTQLNLKF